MANKAKTAPRPQLSSVNATYDRETKQWTHIPPSLDDVQEGRCKWRYIWCAGFDTDEKGVKHYHHNECIPCHCPPGPQIQALQSRAREIALWGGRGSSKSESTFAFLTLGNSPGNYDRLNMHPADHSYLNCADYCALVIRKNAKDLRNYFERAKRYFSMFGGVPTMEPMGFTFPSGAYFILDHMADGDAWEKYQGPEWTRMVIEEAPQIGNETHYLKLIAACRTSNPDMLPQIMLTANPGGVGWPWFKARFLNPGGKRIPSNRVYTDPYSGKTRIHIMSTVDDNPVQLAKGYDKDLDSYRASDMALYKQWRLGDPDAVAGQFFEMFREKRNPSEPENACHVVKPHSLDPYWPRAIGCDWGYSHLSAVEWGCWHPKRQLHIYREFTANRLGAVELGAEIARRSLPDLEHMAVPHLNLFLSHDAFARENDRSTEAEEIREGINRIIGKDAAFVFSPSEEERLMDHDTSWEAVKRRAQAQRKKTVITIINAGRRRRANFNMVRDYMRWTPITGPSAQFNLEVYRAILENDGALAALEYEKKCQASSSEILPILQIHYDADAKDSRDRGCEKLIGAIQSGVEKETDREELEKAEGDDPIDALAYLVGNFPFAEGMVPREEEIRRKIVAIREKNPGVDMNGLIMSARRIEQQHRERSSHGFSFGRLAGPTGRRMRRAG